MSHLLEIPLANLKIEHQGVLDLGDCRIVPPSNLSGQSMKMLTDHFQLLEPRNLYPLFGWDHVLKRPLEGTFEEARKLEQTILDRALIIFKLFKDTIVHSEATLLDQGNLTWYVHCFPYSRSATKKYLVTAAEIAEFTAFWKEFSEIDPHNFAAYRFNLADIRPYLSDRVVDHVESLEYLLVLDSGEHEIAYKFRSRGALMFGTDTETRRKVYADLKRAYDLRSAIVHGDAGKEGKLLKGSSWEDEIGRIRPYNREAIIRFYRAGCLYDAEERSNFLEENLIFGQ